MPEIPSLNRRSFLAATGVAALGAALGGCGPSSAGQAGIDKVLSTQTEPTFWT